MVLYQGALDYYIVKKDNKNIIIMLDNHALEEYCQFNEANIDALFKEFLDKDDATVVLEEIVGNVNYKTIFNSKHLTIFEKFYEKYRTNENVFSIDIRILLNMKDNLKAIFNLGSTEDNIILNVRTILDKTRKLHPMFEEHYQKLLKGYLNITDNNGNHKINLKYPFEIFEENMNMESVLSGIMELYAISFVLNGEKNNTILYFGAAHSVVICKLLISYYGYEMKRNNKLKINEMDTMEYDDFKILGSMCIDFKI